MIILERLGIAGGGGCGEGRKNPSTFTGDKLLGRSTSEKKVSNANEGADKWETVGEESALLVDRWRRRRAHQSSSSRLDCFAWVY